MLATNDLLVLLALLILCLVFIPETRADRLEACNVVWKSPSENSSGSMPLGNGDVGLNVWVEEDGDLLFYISKTDAWSENCRLLKLGRVRVKLTPNPFAQGLPFRQVLRLKQGEIYISAGEEESQVRLRVWVDANQPVVHVETVGRQDFEVQVSLELWRNQKRQIEGKELDSAYGLAGAPYPVYVYPDTVVDDQRDRIVWYHRNEKAMWRENLELQGLDGRAGQLTDPLLHRTFGGLIAGVNLVRENATCLQSTQRQRHYLVNIYLLTAQTGTADQWISAIEQVARQVSGQDIVQARAAHQQWWHDFWNRSWIRASGSEDAEVVTRGYTLQRFIKACGGRGGTPIKFNGSIFTVDSCEPNEQFGADYRRWGGPYWFQNTRLAYWPMLASGDFDLMPPLFQMYRNALPLAEERTRIYFGHEGAFFPETMYFWGTYANNNYGWDRAGRAPSFVKNNYIRLYWQGGIELTAMMLDYYQYTPDEAFLTETLLPLADAIIRFYDQHYPRDEHGKIVFKPAAALETWFNAVNPLPEIAGLRFVLNKLLALPEQVTSETQRSDWQRLLSELPPVPAEDTDEGKILAAAQQITGGASNIENPELYAIFPYRLYGVGKPDLGIGRLTFEKRRVKRTGGWTQDAIQAAYLGLADVARNYVVENFSNHHAGSRFPAFWGPNFDWIPDQDHGSVAVMALQTMLMQTDGDRILLFPAGPRDWDVEFKLHAPKNTTVQGIYRNGTWESREVSPPARAKDITVLGAK